MAKNDKHISGETEAAMNSGGESQGEDYPNQAAKGRKQGGFQGHGGQTEMGYHGSGQLGDEQVGEGNQNAPAKSKDD